MNKDKVKVITVSLPLDVFNILQDMFKSKMYPSRSEIIHLALRDFFKSEVIYLEKLVAIKKHSADILKKINERVIGKA